MLNMTLKERIDLNFVLSIIIYLIDHDIVEHNFTIGRVILLSFSLQNGFCHIKGQGQIAYVIIIEKHQHILFLDETVFILQISV